MSMPKHAMDFREQHSAAEKNEDESKNSFVVAPISDSHTLYNLVLLLIRYNSFADNYLQLSFFVSFMF
jgi:hypothetical protein